MLLDNSPKKLILVIKSVLCDKEGFQIALLTVESIWEPNIREASKVYETTDIFHPAVSYLFNKVIMYLLEER